MAGSMRQRGTNSWELRYRGKQKTVKAKNEQSASRALAIFVADVDRNRFRPPSKLTIAEFSERWIRDYANPRLAATTRRLYLDKLEKIILPAIGHVKLDQLDPTDLMDLWANLREDGMRGDGKPGGMGIDTMETIYKVISSLYSHAVEWKLVDKDQNPCPAAKPPKPLKKTKKKPFSLDPEQTRLMLLALQEEHIKYRVLVALAILTGARRGELLGLEWAAIDFLNKTLSIVQSSLYVVEVGIYQDLPKSESSFRTLAIPDEMIPLLETYKTYQEAQQEKCGDLWKGTGFLFTQWNGLPMHPNTVDTWWAKFREDIGYPEMTFHNLRNTNITTLLKILKIDPKSTSENSGHSQTHTTTEIYGAELNQVKREIADKVGTLFGSQVSALSANPDKKKIRRKKKSSDYQS
ncbi:MAG: tyrosine-type recombinase/integrase [Syntrophomonas sp.]